MNILKLSPGVKYAPVSFEQERMWTLDRFSAGGAEFNLADAVWIAGEVDEALLVKGLNALIRRHEILRTCFEVVDERPQQRIHDEMLIDIPVSDLCGLTAAGKEDEIRRLTSELQLTSFDLAAAPLWSFRLIRCSGTERLALLSMHHSICDGDWSMRLFFEELARFHEGISDRSDSAEGSTTTQYQDYARRQREHWSDREFGADIAYWRQRLGTEASQSWGTRSRPPAKTNGGSSRTLVMSDPPRGHIAALAEQAGVPLFVSLIAAFKILLYRYTREEKITVGYPVSGRRQPSTENLIGYFGNPMALRTKIGGDMSYRAVLREVAGTVMEAEAHQECPFQYLVEALRPARDLTATPFFQTLFSLRNCAQQDWSQRRDAGTTDRVSAVNAGRDRLPRDSLRHGDVSDRFAGRA